ncbi:hypothetical protein BSKO_11546 [Bryopsis sp. KO-2023]|nr:hypothetical protein BSKO_11546 [Bryopsis sp. KO-2023]
MGGGMGGGMGQGQGQDLEWDPDNVLGPAESGHIARREMQRMMKKDSSFGETLKFAQTQEEKELMVRRESREVPDDPAALVEFFLDTEMEDMEFEVARCRPKLTEAFFEKLDSSIGDIRFAGIDVDEDRLAELETLREYLKAASSAVDEAAHKTTDAVERFKRLVTSKDKKATIIEMVANNEIDQGLLDLFTQNIKMAEAAEEEKKAEFMIKLKRACEKYFIQTEENRPDITPLMNASAKAGAIDAQSQTLYDPSAPKEDPNVLKILDPKGSQATEGEEPKKLIIDP